MACRLLYSTTEKCASERITLESPNLCSCASHKTLQTQVVETILHDTLKYINKEKYDSIYINRTSDIDRTRDTITITKMRTEYRYKLFRDTIYKCHTDTLIRTDTVCVYTHPLKGEGRERVFTWFDTLSYFSSGYRCPVLNLKVGGAYASQHTMGEAADIQIPKTVYTDWDDNKAHTDKDILNRWFEFLITHTDFDQAILETSNGRDYWIHISCRKNKKKNRHQVLRLTKK